MSLHFVSLLLIALLLSFVPFSVAVSSSIYRCIGWKEALRIAFVFALSQAGMVMLGWLIGYGVRGLFYSMATPVAAIIVFFIGFRIFMDAMRLGRESRIITVENNNRILYGFAFVTSINALLLGMGLGIMYSEVLLIGGLLAGTVFVMTILGIRAGKMGMMKIGKTMELLAGTGLVVISVLIVLQYLKIL